MSKVPKLRFPEFEGEWEEKELGEVGSIITGKTPSTKEEELWNGDILFVTPTDMNESKYQHSTERTVKKTDKMNVLPEKSVMVTCIASIGKMSLSTKPSITNQQINSIVPYKEISDNEFLYYAILKDIDKIKASQSSSTVPIINKAEFAKINTFIPSIAEQQKIADCLSSLDELIEARKEKIASLKAYKKGLLQQLFPDKVSKSTPPPLIFNKLPKLRFIGFEGEWEEVTIESIFKITRGNVLPMTLLKQEYSKEYPYPVYSSQTKNNGLAGYYNEFLYENAITWTTDGANAGEVNYRKEKFYCTNVCGVLISEKGYANKCIAELINSVSKSYVSYVGNPKLMNGVMGSIKIQIPTEQKEQQKIANCLLSLDEKIAAETEQVAQLQQHKKGLLQQLLV